MHLKLCCWSVLLVAFFGSDLRAQVIEPGPLKAWADDYFRSAFEARRFSGAVVGVVRGGKVILLEGYGYEDPIAETPVDPVTTRFAIASVTKTFTSIAAVQLHDDGLIESLDDPANNYLKRVQLPSKNGRQVTVRHLLTHTGGFDNKVLGMGTRKQISVPVTPDFIRARLPDLLQTPGDYVVYSNIGMGLLGVLVEDVTGQSLQSYMQARIFAPLDMGNATLNYDTVPDVPLAKSAAMAKQGPPRLVPFVANTPVYSAAGSILASGEDMVRYVWALLDAGRTTSRAVLPAEKFASMYTVQARNHQGVTGVGLGFFQYEWNGVQVIGHAGEKYMTSSYLALFPELDAGLFVAIAGGPGEGAEPTRLTAYGDVKNTISPLITGREAQSYDLKPFEDARRYEGLYLRERSEHTGVGWLINLLTPLRVLADQDGYLHIDGGPPLGEIVPNVAASAGGPNEPPSIYAFGPGDRTDRAEIVYFNSDVALRAKGLANIAALQPIAVTGFGLLLIGAFAVFAPGSCSPLVRAGKWAAGLAPICLLSIPAFILAGFAPGYDYGLSLFSGHALRPVGIQVAAMTAAVLMVVVPFAAGRAWIGAWGESPMRPIWCLLLTISGTGGVFVIASLSASGLLSPVM